ncbi:hypothetical protein K1719_032376 [Acacia pycnantha]|nr:hypothetical protein K1719_032376 [Acacia pycnantha]
MNSRALCISRGSTVEGVSYEDTEFDLDFNEGNENDDASSISDEEIGILNSLQASEVIENDSLVGNSSCQTTESEDYLDKGNPIHACKYFGALFWYNERAMKDTKKRIANTFSMCCLQGKVQLPAMNKHEKECILDAEIVEDIKKLLDDVNPFVKQYRFASSHVKNQGNNDMKLCLMRTRHHDGRTYNVPTASEVAALLVGDTDMSFNVRDIIVEKQSSHPKRINELHASYLPLQYPIIFPFGEDGYGDDIEHREKHFQQKRKKDAKHQGIFCLQVDDKGD